jgi:cobalt-zinc-cadmium efflux system outer membrane protein
LLAEPLTEEAAIRAALLNNRDVRAFYEDLGIARADLVQAGLLRNPVFEGNTKFFDGATEIEFGIAQSFLEVFFIPLRCRVAAAELAAAKASVARRVVGVAFDVRRAYIRHHASLRFVAVHEEGLSVAAASLDLRRRLHAAGNATDQQLAAEESVITQAKLDLAAAESDALEAREPLNVLMGLWGDATAWTSAVVKLEDGPGLPLPRDRCESRAIEASFDLAEVRARAEAAAQRAGLASWERMFSTAEAGIAAKQETSGDWGVGPAAAFDLPVFDQGQARASAAAAGLRRELARYVGTAVEVRSAARVFRERVASLEKRVEFMRTVHLPTQHRLLKEILKKYNAMQIGAFEVLVAQQHHIGLQREQIETLEDLWVARLDLAELLAGNLNRARVADRGRTMHGQDGPPQMERSH